MALKHLSKVVQDLSIHNIVPILVMLECGVTALIVQVSAIVIIRCVSSEDCCGILMTYRNVKVLTHISMVIISTISLSSTVCLHA